MSKWTLEEVPVEAIEVRDQLREVKADAPDIQALAACVRAHGVQQPLAAFRADDRIVLLFGHRRLAAGKLAGLKCVPVQIHDGLLDRAAVVKAQLAENMNRSDLSPLQEARSYAELIRITGSTAREVAREYGRSEAHVSKALKLLTLSEPVRGLLERREIPWSAGYELSRVADPEKQVAMAMSLAGRILTRDALSGQIKRGTRKTKETKGGRLARAVAALGEGQSVTVSGSDLTLDTVIGAIEDYLVRLRKARTKGWSLATLLRALKDQSRARP
jgi:ParB family chromosome partitioning protein